MPRITVVRCVALTLSLAAASPALAIECFSMFDAKNTLVYQSSLPPIDLSQSISEQMARRFPTRQLLISDLGSCPETGVASSTTTTQAAALSPSGNGNGSGAYGADATSPAPVASGSRADASPNRVFARAPTGGRR